MNVERHRKFDIMYDEYIKKHERTLLLEKEGVKGKYVYCAPHPAGGFGNRLPPYVTAFLIALLTDRVLLVNWESKERPFTELVEPGFEILMPSWLDFSKRERYTTYFRGSSGTDLALTANLTTALAKFDVLQVESNDYPLVLFYANPHYQEWLYATFGMNAYSIISRRLFRPHPNVQAIVDDFREKNFGKHNIGIQIRTERNRASPATFARVAKLLQMSYYPTQASTTRYFLATDQEYVRGQIEKVLGNEVIYVEPFRGRYTNDSELYGLVDMILLSSTDLLVISFSSSFGWTASAMEATTSYMVYNDDTYGGLAIVDPCYWAMPEVLATMSDDDVNKHHPLFLQQLRCHQL
jgi:hypothetical protein